MSAQEPELGTFPPPSRPAPISAAGAVESADVAPRFNWRTNAILFGLTVLSVVFVGQAWTARPGMTALQQLASSWTFAVPLLAILLTHEFGHYIAARIHRVPASLPYFLPMPVLNPFGTLGAVIVMPNRIRSARALLDIGAAGPLAGMAVAVPLMIVGLSLSEVGPRGSGGGGLYIQEGQSLLYWALKTLVHGHIPATHDVHLHPTALAAWAGFFVTFLNLLPFGQLDGGHVAYALLGRRQDRIARFMPLIAVAMAIYNAWLYLVPPLYAALARGQVLSGWGWLFAAGGAANWLFLLVLLRVLGRASGTDHPPVDDAALDGKRKAIAVFTLALFVLLFMPSPWVTHQSLGKTLDLVELPKPAR